MIDPVAPVAENSSELLSEPVHTSHNRLTAAHLARPNTETASEPVSAAANRSRIRKTLLLATCGQLGMAAVSVLAMIGSMALVETPSVPLLAPVVTVLVIRLLYLLTRGPEPVLTRFMVRKTLRRTLVDEAKITAGLFAAAFLLEWQMTPADLTMFALFNAVAQIAHLGYARSVLRRLARRGKESLAATPATRAALIIGSGTQATAAADLILDSPELDTRLIGFLDWHRSALWRYRDVPLIGHPDQLAKIIAGGQVDAILIAVEPCDLVATQSILATAEEMGVNSYLLSEIHSPDVAALRPEFLGGKPALVWRHVKESRAAIFTKLFLDRLVGIITLAVASPIMLITALAIKLDSRGPVFFKQIRCGLNGRPFGLYKFRTMVADAESRKEELLNRNEMSGPVFKLRHDPRMTRIGRLLRKYSIDELPQLFNIIRGDMSLVGPRPPLPKEVVKYEPWQRRKLSIKPGLTCIWQVSGRNTIDFEQWMRMDLDYIDNWSLWLDAKILVRTIPTVLKGTGM